MPQHCSVSLAIIPLVFCTFFIIDNIVLVHFCYSITYAYLFKKEVYIKSHKISNHSMKHKYIYNTNKRYCYFGDTIMGR